MLRILISNKMSFIFQKTSTFSLTSNIIPTINSITIYAYNP